MRVRRYNLEFEDGKNILVKESSKNYPDYDTLNDAGKVADFMDNVFRAGKKSEEYVWLLAINSKMGLNGVFEVSHGTIAETITSPRDIFTRCLLCNAASFILVHNHPSGSPTPSSEDFKVTRRLIEAGCIMGLPIMDHVIIGNKEYFSFREDTGLWNEKK